MTAIPDTSCPVVVLDPLHANLGAVRTLGRCGVTVYGIYRDDRAPAARSRYCRRAFVWNPWTMSVEHSIEVLGKIGRQIGGKPMLIAADDDSALLVAAHQAALGETFLFPRQPEGLPAALSSKRGMYHLCREWDVPTPETVFPESRADVEAFIESGAAMPVVLKGIDGLRLRLRCGVSMTIVESPEQLLCAYDRMEDPEHPNLMLQEYIPGTPESIWMFDGYFDADSECVIGIAGQKLRQYPAYTGMTSLGVCRHNPEVEQMTKRFMKQLGFRGLLDLGYRFDHRDGRYKLLDVNPRLGAAFRLFVDRNGLDVVRAMYLDLTGQPVSPAEPDVGRKWLVENFDIVSSYRYWRNRELSPAGWLRSYAGVREAAWFALDDMVPFWAMYQRGFAWGASNLRGRMATAESP
ncbi:MAG: carboxylate--amine ligase [Gaiellales bacterium]